LYPFARLFEQQLASVMVAHLHVPAIDSTPNLATTLSPKAVNGLLRNEMGFDGLVFTDALNMKGVAGFHKPGDVELLALKAGCDVLLFPEDVPKAVAHIARAIEQGEISEQELNSAVRRILRAKEWTGVHRKRYVNTKDLHADLNTPQAQHLKKKLSEAAVTVVQNRGGIIPLRNLTGTSISVLTIGGNGTVFKNRLSKYARIDHVECSAAPTAAEIKLVRDKLQGKNTVIINIEGTNNKPGKNFGLTTAAIDLAESLAQPGRELILVHMGNPYALAKLRNPGLFHAIIIGYQDESNLSRSVAEAIMGAIPATGKLPVSIGHFFPAGSGLDLLGTTRLYHGTPLDYGLAMNAFSGVDSIVIRGLKEKAFPGCQVLVAKGGKIIYNKNFGFHTYEDAEPVKSTDIYDLASITKIAASTLSLMKLQEMGKFNLDRTLGHYFSDIPPESPYHPLVMRRIMAHVAGLPAWVPFYQATVRNGQPRWDIYSRSQNDVYSLRVANHMYMNKATSDSLFYRILDTPLRKDDTYKYSDIGYYFVREIIERHGGERIDLFAERHFYAPLGLTTMGYTPLERHPRERMVPTEYDHSFRKQLLRGDVHDPGAAMQGGIGGHAGLFSNAEDLAVLMQMLINGGSYGGERYLNPETIQEYTRCQYCRSETDENRRGAGFDKPYLREGPGPTCKCVSFESFGHTGFTGTMVWADPVEQVVYVFLSNRVYPTAENQKINKMDIRAKVQAEVYRVLRQKPAAATESRQT
jgi:CubicO group peptidase (beta-lactamase class C family)